MTTAAWIVVIYIIIDRILTVAWIGRKIEITPAVAIASLFTGAFIIWALFNLAGSQ